MSVLVQRRLVVFALAVAFGLVLVFALSRASLASHTDTHEPNNPNGEAPELGENRFIAEDFCDFPVRVESSSKVKLLMFPGGRIIEIGAGRHATLTNLDEPEIQITVHNAAVFHDAPLPNDEFFEVVTGPILLFVFSGEIEGLEQGIYLVSGQLTSIVDSNFQVLELLSQQGGEKDLCARLA
jgi:hypothetical protein